MTRNLASPLKPKSITMFVWERGKRNPSNKRMTAEKRGENKNLLPLFGGQKKTEIHISLPSSSLLLHPNWMNCEERE